MRLLTRQKLVRSLHNSGCWHLSARSRCCPGTSPGFAVPPANPPKNDSYQESRC
ncbi:hypothetical protein CSUI_007478 [Cystoisospora suis]|uniref:Uncharacterized protein n=1 Tax=Cystoisospora suis TaxID=483139 RepID=A0A2C6KQW7_9APIC|nr:hypothetical protein CSUI_007478 [Cystoisospora suis]